MDFTQKTIWAFFALCYIANYVNMLSLNEIIHDHHFRESKGGEKHHLEKSAHKYFVIMNVLYVSLFAAMFGNYLSVSCSVERAYPLCFTAATGLYFINAVYN